MENQQDYSREALGEQSTDALIELMLMTEGDDACTCMLFELHRRGTRDTFDKARDLCLSTDPERRSLGVDILGQLGTHESLPFAEETANLLLDMLPDETDADVLGSIALAMGHATDPRTPGALSPLANHSDAWVRKCVVHGLLIHEDPLAASVLVRLAHDPDRDVRDWATFALTGIREGEPPEVLEVLRQRVSDPDAEIRSEALLGLASRRDPGVLDLLIRELSETTIWHSTVEAALELADPRLCPILLALRDRMSDWPILDDAIQACGCGPVPPCSPGSHPNISPRPVGEG